MEFTWASLRHKVNLSHVSSRMSKGVFPHATGKLFSPYTSDAINSERHLFCVKVVSVSIYSERENILIMRYIYQNL